MRDIVHSLALGPKNLEQLLEDTGGTRSLVKDHLKQLVAAGRVTEQDGVYSLTK